MSTITYPLGKQPAKHDPRTLELVSYLRANPSRDSSQFVSAPLSDVRLDRKVRDFPMLGNDRYGDCVIAGALHEHQQFLSVARGIDYVPTEEAALSAYGEITGFDPNDPSTDKGTVVLDALNYRRHEGIDGHKLYAFARIEPTNRDLIRTGVYIFGAVGVGLALPLTAQSGPWVYKPEAGSDAQAGSWGGHYVPIIGYSTHGPVCVTWGRLKTMSWAFLTHYCDEAWALLSQDWVDTGGKDYQGLDFTQLDFDLGRL